MIWASGYNFFRNMYIFDKYVEEYLIIQDVEWGRLLSIELAVLLISLKNRRRLEISKIKDSSRLRVCQEILKKKKKEHSLTF